jgi:hypothetical protein
MATSIPIITQEEADPLPLSFPNATMAPSYHITNPTSVASLTTTTTPNTPPMITASKKRFVQRTLEGKVSNATLKAVTVRSHKRKSPLTKARFNASKAKPFMAHIDCKASRALALTLHIEDVRKLMKRK